MHKIMRTALLCGKTLLGIALVLWWLSPEANAANSDNLFVVVPDVTAKDVNGELSFCERANLKGLICGSMAKVFGKTRFMARNWWSPETYVAAYTGTDAVITGIEPTSDGRGLVIYYGR